MKTKTIIALLLISAGAFAQNVSSTTGLTSGGQLAGTQGSGTYYGVQAGTATTSSSTFNTFIGNQSALYNTTSNKNVFVGSHSGSLNTTGSRNTFVGHQAGSGNTTGNDNVYYGNQAGMWAAGNRNTFIGAESGSHPNNQMTSNDNIFIGYKAGYNQGGSGNVIIGNYAGWGGAGSNALIIANSQSNVLINGDFASKLLRLQAQVGIGFNGYSPVSESGTVDVSHYHLFVEGGILTEALRVSLTNTWGDYVFDDDYRLKPLDEVECFIAENGHLPEIPSAAEVKRDGIELGEMARLQQVKIEELTLYIIEQNKKLTKLETLETEVAELRKLLLLLSAAKE